MVRGYVVAFLGLTPLLLDVHACGGGRATGTDARHVADGGPEGPVGGAGGWDGGQPDATDGAMGDRPNDGPLVEAASTARCRVIGVSSTRAASMSGCSTPTIMGRIARTRCVVSSLRSRTGRTSSRAPIRGCFLLGSGVLRSQTISRLEFDFTRGWDVTWSTGQRLDVLNLLREIDCRSQTRPRSSSQSRRSSACVMTAASSCSWTRGISPSPQGE